jgi:hypothetical protein
VLRDEQQQQQQLELAVVALMLASPRSPVLHRVLRVAAAAHLT